MGLSNHFFLNRIHERSISLVPDWVVVDSANGEEQRVRSNPTELRRSQSVEATSVAFPRNPRNPLVGAGCGRGDHDQRSREALLFGRMGDRYKGRLVPLHFPTCERRCNRHFSRPGTVPATLGSDTGQSRVSDGGSEPFETRIADGQHIQQRARRRCVPGDRPFKRPPDRR